MGDKPLDTFIAHVKRHRLRCGLLGLAGAFVVALGVGVGVVNHYLNGSGARTLIAAAVEEATGRNVAINGKLSLHWSRSPVIVAEDVTFGNAEWGQAEHFAAVKRFEMEMALDPLRRGKVEIKRLILVEPDINMEVAADGAVNWGAIPVEDFGFTGPIPADPAARTLAALNAAQAEVVAAQDAVPEAAMQKSLFDWEFSGLNIDRVEIRDGLIHYADAVTGQGYSVVVNRLGASGVKEHGPVTFDELDAVVDGKRIRGRLTAELMASGTDVALQDMDLTFDGRTVAGRARVEMTPGKAEFGLRDVAVAVDGHKIDGAVRIATTDTTRIGLRAMALKIDGHTLRGSLWLDGDAQKQRAVLSQVDVAADGYTVKGTGTVAMIDNRPRLDGNLSVDKIDLGDLGLVDMAPQKAAPGAPAYAFSKEPMDLSWMTLGDGDLKLAVKTFVTRDDLILRDAKIDVTVDHGKIDVKSLTAKLAGGEIKVATAMTYDTAAGVIASVDIELHRINGGQLFEQAGQKGLLAGGRTDAKIQLTMQGHSRHDLVSSLNGRLLMAMGEGKVKTEAVRLDGADHFMEAFRNVNAAGNLLSASSGREVSLAIGGVKLLSELFQAVDPMGSKDKATELQCAVVHVGFKDGIMLSDNGIAVESDAKTFVVKGGIDFNTEQIDLTVRPEKTGFFGINTGPLVDPIRIGGTLMNPDAGINGESVAATVLSIGAAFATGGMSIMAETVAGFVLANDNPCQTALEG